MSISQKFDVARQFVVDYRVEDLARFFIAKQPSYFVYFFLIFFQKFGGEKVITRYGYVGSVKLAFVGNPVYIFKHVGQGGCKREQDYHVFCAVFSFRLGVAQHGLAVKAVSAHKSVTCEKVGYFDPVFFANTEDFVGSVSHSVDYLDLF